MSKARYKRVGLGWGKRGRRVTPKESKNQAARLTRRESRDEVRREMDGDSGFLSRDGGDTVS